MSCSPARWVCCLIAFILHAENAARPFSFHKLTQGNLDTHSHIYDLLLLYFTLLSSLLIALFLVSFSSILSPYHSFTQFSPHYLCSCSNISYYCPYTSLSSHHSCVLILTCFIVFPVSSCSLFSHFISRLLTDISRLPITHSQITAVDNYQVKIQQFLRYY